MKRNIFVKLGFIALSLPKTVFFNLKTFGMAGIKLPVLVSYRTKIRETHKGAIQIDNKVKPFIMTFGYGGSDGVVSNPYSELCLERNSKLIIKGRVQFAEGCSIRNSGTISIGDKSGMNKNSFISCYDKIEIGNFFTAGWNVNIRDSDGHIVVKDGAEKPYYSAISIGDYVWIGAHADVLKGVTIGNHCVVAYRSLVVKSMKDDNLLIGGCPAKVLQNGIDWID